MHFQDVVAQSERSGSERAVWERLLGMEWIKASSETSGANCKSYSSTGCSIAWYDIQWVWTSQSHDPDVWKSPGFSPGLVLLHCGLPHWRVQSSHLRHPAVVWVNLHSLVAAFQRLPAESVSCHTLPCLPRFLLDTSWDPQWPHNSCSFPALKIVLTGGLSQSGVEPMPLNCKCRSH